MTSPSLELQIAIVTRLKSSSEIVGLVGARVFDHVPADASYPYISLGPSDEVSDDADCIDGFEIAMQIDVWSDEVGYPQVRSIANIIRRALKLELPLADNAMVSFEHRITRFMRGDTPLISHAALSFTAFVEQP